MGRGWEAGIPLRIEEIKRGIAELENSKSPYRAQGIKSQRIYGRRKRPEIALREERALEGELRNWNRRLEKWQKQE